MEAVTKERILNAVKGFAGASAGVGAAITEIQSGFVAKLIEHIPGVAPWAVWLAFAGIVAHGLATGAKALGQALAGQKPQIEP